MPLYQIQAVLSTACKYFGKIKSGELGEGLTFDEWRKGLKEEGGKEIFAENAAKGLTKDENYDIMKLGGDWKNPMKTMA